MKLIICDEKKLQSFQLPNKVDNIFVINFDYYINGSYFSEIININVKDNKWIVYSENKSKLRQNNNLCDYVILNENSFFEIKYADIPNYIPIFIIPNFFEFYQYSLININKIDIGNSSECQIRVPNFSNISCTILKNNSNYYIEKKDCKLCYLNNYSFLNEKLNMGDVIFINGIILVFMKNFIMINPLFYRLTINNLPFIDKYQNEVPTITPVNEIEKNVKLYKENQLFVHTPRLKEDIEEINFSFDLPTQKEVIQKTPIIFTVGSSAIITMTSSVSLISSIRSFLKGERDTFSLVLEFMVFGTMLISGLVLPYIMDVWEKNNTKKREKVRQKKYMEYINNQEETLKQIVLKQTSILNNNHLSLDKIQTNIINGCKDVWNREIFDNDFLSLTLGYGNIPAKINIEIPKKNFTVVEDNLTDLAFAASNKKYILQDVPIVVSLLKNFSVPIVIDSKYKYDYIHSIMLQLIYFYSGNDLKIITITNEEKKNKWEFMKYVSHSWSKNYDRRFFATTSEEVAQLSMYLEQEFENRKSTSDSSKNTLNYNEHYLIVTDDYLMTHDLTILNKIYNSEGNYGFSILIFEDSIKNLPSQFNTLIQIVDDNGVMINRKTATQEQLSFKPTYVPNLDIDGYARIIANIPINIKDQNSSIPNNIPFLELFNATRIDQLNILSRWASNNPTISLNTPVGVKENNKLIELDLHEKYHGPHGLIAGSTGSGKSEFIITYILSLAINYHPYEVQFVLIDYKGGGLAGAFEQRDTGIKLPHLVGTITNLDISEMNRTLTSIKSELQRRQKIFNEAREKNNESTIDIYKYQRLYREGKVSEPLSHLFIISDEFAELKANQPDFMDELVSAARIGRSLGIHLILATQKPSGVVDDQIWSNTRFRVCLKVQTTEDSEELLKRNDAAYLTDAGRFYLQVGNNEIFELGQSGWAGAKYKENGQIGRKKEDDILFLNNNGEIIKAVNEEIKQDESLDKGDQLTNIVQYLYDLAIKENIKFSSLWKDNIPEKIYYEDIIKKYNLKPTKYKIEPIIGEYDDPEHQEQGYEKLPLTSCGNTLIVGLSGSGKTTLLSNIIFSIIVNHNCDEVNIYIIDLGSEKLKEFQNAPQIGEVLTLANIDTIKFLFYMLEEEKNKRFAYYSSHGSDFENDINNGKAPFPSIIVIINQFEVFKESFEEIIENSFSSFTRNCTKVGIIFILTSTQTNALNYGYENNFPKKIMLNMLDNNDYSTYFDTNIIPKKNPGRGIISLNDNTYEFQVPLLFKANYENNLNYIISKLCLCINKRAKKVPIVPEEISYDLLEEKIADIKNLPIGINIQTAQVSTYNFDNLLNILCSNSMIAIKNFLPVLTHMLCRIDNTNIIIINSLKNLKIGSLIEGVYYDANFTSVIKVINDNINKYQQSPKNNQFVIIFLGYASLQKHLQSLKEENEEIITIDDLVLNAKAIDNFKFIIYDNESGISSIGESNIDLYFKRNNGIWVGKGFDSQSVFDIEMQYDNNTYGNGTITIIKNGKMEHVKFM